MVGFVLGVGVAARILLDRRSGPRGNGRRV
jgi:hypothetical protein